MTLLLIVAAGTSVSAQTAVGDSLKMDSLVRSLPEVMIKGERPMVKVKGAALVYDIDRITEGSPVDNAYDALKEIPGVVETGGSLTLGGREVTVIIDGRVTNMTQEQTAQLLKSMSKDRLKDVEVMYNAPARYQVNGACINVNMRRDTGGSPVLAGEVYGRYDQSRRASFQERASIVYSGRKLSADFMYSLNHGEGMGTRDMLSRHSLNDGTVHEITSFQRSLSTSHVHQMRFSMGYDFAEKHNLSASYYGTYTTSHNRQTTKGSINGFKTMDSKPWMHDVTLDYRTPIGLTLGAEYTFYENPEEQDLSSVLTNRTLDFASESSQKIDLWKVYAKQEHALKGGWGLNYGATYTIMTDNSYQYYLNTGDAEQDLPTDKSTWRRENIVNVYAGFSKNFNDKVTVDASLAAEYYNSDVWNEWNLLPVLNVTYTPSQKHTLQLSMSSGSAYPEYWAVQDFVGYSNGGYDEYVGNPTLKPKSQYRFDLIYVFNNKYILQGSFTYVDDLFKQTLYQRPDQLTEMFKFVNFDFSQRGEILAYAPFKLGSWYNGDILAVGVWERHKDSDFYDIPFDRAKFYGIFATKHDFRISAKPEITFSINGMIYMDWIQGDYDIPTTYDLNAALQMKFLKDKRATLKLYCNDILEAAQTDHSINYKGQWQKMDFSSFRHFGVSFSYAFGNYKEKQHRRVDMSRFRL